MRRLLVVLSVLGAAGDAWGFSDPSLFTEPARDGGSGGRHFTGTPVDPYTCDVCHSGGSSPEIRMVGWPEHLTAEGVYDLEFLIPAEASIAMQVEVLADGAPAPMELPPVEELGTDERCDGAVGGPAAVYRHEWNGRWIVGVQDCGARRLRVRVLAGNVSTLSIRGAAVQSDGESDMDGDGVHLIAADTGDIQRSGCSIAISSTPPWWMFAWLFIPIASRKRRWNGRPKLAPSPRKRDSGIG